jgi:predicted nucleotidyltransferase
MRLSETDKLQLIKFAKQYFGKNIKLYLFGSRTDDSKKGGDIDLFLESEKQIDLQQQLQFLASIYRHVTERKIDLVVKTPFTAHQTIHDTAKQQGIRLC